MSPTVNPTVKSTLDMFSTLLPIAASVCAVIGGVSVPVTLGLNVAKALLPIADEFIMQVGTQTFSLDTTGITTPQQVRDLLNDKDPWPELQFISGAANPAIAAKSGA